MKKIIFTLALISFNTTCFAQTDENTTLILYFTNKTEKIIKFDHVAAQKPGNEFTVYPDVINPGEASVITAETLANNDIDARLVFVSPDGDQVFLSILDQLQFHYGRPVFNVTGDSFKSIELAKTRNKNHNPRYLMYVNAGVQLVNK